MAVKLVQIVNPNGRKGWVAETSRAAAAYMQPPSDRAPAGSEPGVEEPADKPKRRRATEKTAAPGATPNTTATKSEED